MSDHWVRLLILLPAAIFASYGLSYTIAKQDGPWDVLHTLRDFLGAYDYGENGQVKKWYGKFISCPYCIGVWIALILALVLFSADPLWPLYWWTIVGGQFRLLKGRRMS